MIPLVQGKTYHLTLLAVSETENQSYIGSTADLFLEVRQGTGKVLMDTYPLTKSDTQLSTRFAKEIACKFLDEDCSIYDFIYTIRASSPIIGGPSAGGAITALTVAALSNFDVDETVAMTGTINSGGLIGPVGGVREKVEAASKKGLTKVLIPYGDITLGENESINITELIRELHIEVKEIIDVEDAVYELTGKNLSNGVEHFEIDGQYEQIMENLGEQLCQRTKELFFKVHMEMMKQNEEYKNISISHNVTDYTFEKNFVSFFVWYVNSTEANDSSFSNSIQEALDLYNKSLSISDESSFYSAASFCFGANVKLHNNYLLILNYSTDEFIEKLDTVAAAIESYQKYIQDKKYETITDFQTYMIVQERLIEAQQYIKQANESLIVKISKNITLNSTQEQNNSLNISVEKDSKEDSNLPIERSNTSDEDKILLVNDNSWYYLAFAIERLYSAKAWASFYDTGKTRYDFNKGLKESCTQKIDEVTERIQYVKLYLPTGLASTEESLDNAKKYRSEGDFELCLFKASLAKAQVSIIMSMFGVNEDARVDRILELKFKKAKEAIAKEANKGRFPILGYSYYEYGKSLETDDRFSALLYAEYALELSNLDIYFEREKKADAPVSIFAILANKTLGYIVAALIIGIIVGFQIRGTIERRKITRSIKSRKK